MRPEQALNDIARQWASQLKKGPGQRFRVFEEWKAKFCRDLAEGERGWRRYRYLEDIVLSSNDQIAIESFHRIFPALLDQELLRARVIEKFAILKEK
jgi:hypothetical protein